MIELKNISKVYKSGNDSVTAIKDINFTINDGEIFGIIGLSGAGKSTLVRCINFLERPTEGEVIIDGKNLGQMSKKELLEARRGIGMIFQGFNLLEQRTVLKNVCFPLEIAGMKKSDAVKRARELLQLVSLGDKEKSYPSQLSGGQKQRVAIARALAADPKYLLCDEATSALDPDTTRSILDLMKKINRELGITIIVITHEMSIIDSICDRVAVLDNSTVAEIGDVNEIFANPKSEIAKKLVLPKVNVGEINEGKKLRIVFNGESSGKPVLAGLILECGTAVNILHAETKDIDGKAYGQLIIQIPEASAERIEDHLIKNQIEFSLLAD